MTTRTVSLITALSFVTCAAAGCSAIEASGGGNPQQAVHRSAARYVSISLLLF
jgi:hypothetical protein